MTDNRVRRDAKEFWLMVQENNAARPARKRPPEGASCGSCASYKGFRCTYKRKLVQPYNICDDWRQK